MESVLWATLHICDGQSSSHAEEDIKEFIKRRIFGLRAKFGIRKKQPTNIKAVTRALVKILDNAPAQIETTKKKRVNKRKQSLNQIIADLDVSVNTKVDEFRMCKSVNTVNTKVSQCNM